MFKTIEYFDRIVKSVAFETFEVNINVVVEEGKCEIKGSVV